MVDSYCKIIDGEIDHCEVKDPTSIETGDDGFPVWRIHNADPAPEVDQIVYDVEQQENVYPSEVRTEYIVTVKPLQEVQLTISNRLVTDETKLRNRSTFLFGGEEISGSVEQSQNIQEEYNYANSIGETYYGTWYAINNSAIALDLAGVTDLSAAFRTNTNLIKDDVSSIKEDVLAATTSEEAGALYETWTIEKEL